MIDIENGPDPELSGHWRTLPLWQRWALYYVADDVTLKTQIRDELTRDRKFCVSARRGHAQWECEIAMAHFDDAHDVDFVIVTMLHEMRLDLMLPEHERETKARDRLRGMASGIVPNETPTYAWLKWSEP